jgi:hypothetical protein
VVPCGFSGLVFGKLGLQALEVVVPGRCFELRLYDCTYAIAERSSYRARVVDPCLEEEAVVP